MAEIRAAGERLILAPAGHVYTIIADYTTWHPKILPPAFSNLQVVEGGTGEGTVITFSLRLGGRQQDFRARVTEPEPGRVLEETSEQNGAVTRFTVDPESSDRCRVRIETSYQGQQKGLAGAVERMFAPRLLQRLYTQELMKLAAVAEGTNVN